MTTRNEIHVIGAGLAGLTAAAFVARAGLPVVVHETRNRVGGRATTDDRDGFRFDQGPHALYRGGAAERVLGDLGIRPRGSAPDGTGCGCATGGRTERRPGAPRCCAPRWSAGGASSSSPASWPPLARLHPAEHAQRTVADWIEGTVRDEGARQVVSMLVRLTTYADRPHELSADAAIGMLQAGLGPGVRYLERGWNQLVDALAATPGVRIARASCRDVVPRPRPPGRTAPLDRTRGRRARLRLPPLRSWRPCRGPSPVARRR